MRIAPDGVKRWTPRFRIIDTADVTPDAAIAQRVAQYQAEIDKALDVDIGVTKTPLDSRKASVRGQETAIGNYFTDTMRAITGADIAILNGGGIRGNRTYASGSKLTRKDIARELPFNNQLVTLELTGADLRAALENAVWLIDKDAGRFAQISGARIVVRRDAVPGSRLASIEIGGSPLDDAKRYKVATIDFLARGKDVPISEIHHKVEAGIAITEAIMTIDLGHNVISGFEHGFRDIFLVPDLSVARVLPNDPTTALVMGDLREADGSPYQADPRHRIRAAVEALAKHGLAPIVAPELEFYLVDPVTYETYTPYLSNVYTVGDRSDPRGVFREIFAGARDLGLDPLGGAQEYGCGQFEINLRHGPALESADRNFLFKAHAKETAARHGLLATFIGKLRDDEGSGMHLHVSLMDAEGENAFADPSREDGLSDVALRFAAGVLAHTPALTAFLCPTVNAYRRIEVESLAPTHMNWGRDNRLAMLRFPNARGKATRLELRVGDGAANIYTAIAGLLWAGLDGIERNLELPAECARLPYEDEETLGEPLPASLDAALAALAADEHMTDRMGARLCEIWQEIKAAELSRWQAELAKVTAWERQEYAHHL